MSEIIVNFLSAYGQFKMWQWIKDLAKIWGASSFRILHRIDSRDMNTCHFPRFGVLKKLVTDREFVSNDQITHAMTGVWDNLTFNFIQSVFQNWTSRVVWVIEAGGAYILEWDKISLLKFIGTFLTSCLKWLGEEWLTSLVSAEQKGWIAWKIKAIWNPDIWIQILCFDWWGRSWESACQWATLQQQTEEIFHTVRYSN
jgi:hypothetical protein